MLPETSQIQQSRTSPPAQPRYILRGHSAQIHAVHFFDSNLKLLSGDAEGWVVIWDVSIKRSLAVWRAHQGGVLGLGTWPGLGDGDGAKIITLVSMPTPDLYDY